MAVGRGGWAGIRSVSRTSAMKAKRCRQTALAWLKSGGAQRKALKVEQEQ